MMNIILTLIIISLIGPVAGSLIGVIKRPSNRLMFNMLAFAAGTMLAVSFLQLIPESIKLSSVGISIAGIAIGSVFMYLLDKAIPHIHPSLCTQEPGQNLKKTGVFLFLGMFLHNFPEGMAVAVGLTSNIRFGLAIAIAIAIHDIPEGICTSAPYYYSSKKRLKSFLLSASTAVPTIIGLLLTYQLSKYLSLPLIGLIIAATAGLMIYISADELIPSSCCKLTQHSTIFSLIAGVLLVLALKLL